jgi:hypothetical protein
MPLNARIRVAALGVATVLATLGVYWSFSAASPQTAPAFRAPGLQQEGTITSSVVARLPVERPAPRSAPARSKAPVVGVAAPRYAAPVVAAAPVRVATKPFHLPEVPASAAPVRWKQALKAPRLPHAPVTAKPKKQPAPVVRTVAAFTPVTVTHVAPPPAPALPDLDSVPTPKIP